MAIALKVTSLDRTRRKLRISFTLTFSGSYVSGGDTLDFTKATDAKFLGYRIPFGAPEQIFTSDCAPGGFTTEAIEGNANNNSLLKIFQAGSGSAAPVELSAGAYPAAITGDLNAQIEVVWGRGSN